MLKAGALALVAFLTLSSPTFAKSKPAAPAQCTTLDQVAKETIAADKEIKVEGKFVGDELKALNDKIHAKLGLNPPDGQDGVMLLSKPGKSVWVMVQSFKGCAGKVSLISPDFLKKLDETPAKDDGSI